MKVFKFGGASVKDAHAVKNVAEIVRNFNNDKLIIIVSAMGKTTNKLEKVIQEYLNEGDWNSSLLTIKNDHIQIAKELFVENHEIFTRIKGIFYGIEKYLTQKNFNSNLELYSEIVSQGEILSTRILRNYLNENVNKAAWLDARKIIKTDFNFIDARLDWDFTQSLIIDKIDSLKETNIVVSQGFIGSNNEGKTTTLGREGSDFSAAIFATCLNAESMTVWKDVPGVLNADPKLMPDATIIKEISYQEASELTYYGASVIHPRTIKPLAQKNIKLFVRPFTAFSEVGTVIGDFETAFPTSFITKYNQVLVEFNVKDFSFIDEKKLSIIFHELDGLNIKINLMQNSAISFSICIDKKFDKVEKLLERLKDKFDITHHDGLTLQTIKNFDEASLEKISTNSNVLLEQRTTKDVHVLYEPI